MMTEQPRVFVIRPSHKAEDRKWQHQELLEGRVRQGWGKSGLSLVDNGQIVDPDEWAQKLCNWLKHDKRPPTLSSAKKRFKRFCLMVEMRAGDFVVVPKLPGPGRCFIAKISGDYRFEVPKTHPSGKDDFGHLIPVDPDTVKHISYDEPGPVWRLHHEPPFKARRDAVFEITDESLKAQFLAEVGVETVSLKRLRQVDPPPPKKNTKVTKGAFKNGSMLSPEEASAIGLNGELLVVQWERQRLEECGRPDLANRVIHVAVEVGDGEGYDVLSFDHLSGEPLHIEVKTTKGKQDSDFFITANEVKFARDNPCTWRLYRVFDVNGDPKFHVLTTLDEELLVPSAYRYVS